MGTIQAGYYGSFFENDIQTLRWDNPYRMTDQTFAAPSGAYINGNGTALGQMALSPSNTAGQFFLNGSFRPLKSTRVYGSLSYGIFSQNEPLLPYTVNTSLAKIFPNALSAPRETAEAKANVTSLDLSVSSRLMKGVHFNAGYRSYGFHNKTEELDMSTGYSRFDQNWENIAIAVEPYSYTRTRIFGDLTWNFWRTTSLKVGYTRSATTRELGEEDEGESDEGTFKASLDTLPMDWLLLRVSYLNGKREWSEDGHKDIYAPGFNFKRYFEASRDRNALNVLAGLSLIKNLDLQFSYMMGKDKYLQSDFGLLKDDFTSFSLDASYVLGPTASVYGFFSNEVYQGLQKSRQSGATISTDTRADWSADLKDTINTFGGGILVPLIRERLDLDLSYTYSKADGASELYSPPGGTPDVAVNLEKPLDTTTLNIAKVRLTYKLMAHFSVAAGYWYEMYKLEDIQRNDVKVDLIVPGAGIYLGALEPGYSYNVAFLKFIWTF